MSMMDTVAPLGPLGPAPPNVAHPVPVPPNGPPPNHYDHGGGGGSSSSGSGGQQNNNQNQNNTQQQNQVHPPTNGGEPMPSSSSSNVDGNNIGNNEDFNRGFPYTSRGKSSVNPETGSVTSSKDDEATYLDDEDDDDSDHSNSEYPEQVEIKPDPMALLERPRRIKRERDGGWDDAEGDEDDDVDYSNTDYERQQTMQLRRNKGGRLRDPIWRFYHQISPNQWQCNDCDYTSLRPQADRLRKHREKCPGLEGQRGSMNDSGPGVDRYMSEKPIPSLSNFSKMSANAITRHLRRIADALEESNKLKKLKLGLDPMVPFDVDPRDISRQN